MYSSLSTLVPMIKIMIPNDFFCSQTETVKIIWSFHDTTDPSSEDISFDLIHTYKGSISLNLLGGLPSAAPDPDDLQYYDITVDNVS